jgi:hypothetical protein
MLALAYGDPIEEETLVASRRSVGAWNTHDNVMHASGVLTGIQTKLVYIYIVTVGSPPITFSL